MKSHVTIPVTENNSLDYKSKTTFCFNITFSIAIKLLLFLQEQVPEALSLIGLPGQ